MAGNISKEVGQCFDLLSTKCSDTEMHSFFKVLECKFLNQKIETKRIKKLEFETSIYKKIAAETEKNSSHCTFCHSLFLLIINNAYPCDKCQENFCYNCIIFFKSPSEMQMCKLCHNEWLKQAKSGQWIFNQTQDPKRQEAISVVNEELSAIQNEIKNHFKVINEVSQPNTINKQINNLLRRGTPGVIEGFLGMDDEEEIPSLSKRSSSDSTSKLNLVSQPKSLSKSNSKRFTSPNDENSYDQSSRPKSEQLPFSDKSISLGIPVNTTDFNLLGESTSIDGDAVSRIRDYHSYYQASTSSYGSKCFPSDFTVEGKILIKIEHSSCPPILKVKILSCRNLAVANKKENTTNPYVKVYLLPDKTSSGKRKTTVKRNTRDPDFNEDITYQIDKNSLSRRTLNISVWHSENIKTNHFLGETIIPISNIRLHDPQEIWYPLKTRRSQSRTRQSRRSEAEPKIIKKNLVQNFQELSQREPKKITLLELAEKARSDRNICRVPSENSTKYQIKDYLQKKTPNRMKNYTKKLLKYIHFPMFNKSPIIKENVPQLISLSVYKGEILIGLQFIKNARRKSDVEDECNMGKMNLFIKNGRHIGDDKHVPSTFVKCQIQHFNIQIGKKDTKVVSNTTNPIWDEMFTFPDIDKNALKDTEITLTIMNKKLRKSESLGELILSSKCRETNGPPCREKDILLWRKFIGNETQSLVEDYLPLRSIID